MRLNIIFCIFYYFFLIRLYQKISTKHIFCESNQEVTGHSGLRWWINHWWYHLMRLCDLIWREEKCLQTRSPCECEGGLLWRYWIICSFIESDQDLWLYSGNMFPRGHIIDTNAESHKGFCHLLLKYHVKANLIVAMKQNKVKKVRSKTYFQCSHHSF